MRKKAKKKSVKKAKKRKPRTHGADGRKKDGKFDKGNQCGVGNKSHTNEKAKELKKALLDAVTEKDIKSIGKKLVSKAKGGDVPSAKELFDRIWGRAKQEVEVNANDDLKSFIDWLVGRNDDTKNTS